MNCRSKYWNGTYYKYWKSRVDEANKGEDKSKIIKGDSITSKNSQVESAIKRLILEPDSIVLEIGSGFGRALPILSNLCQKVYATDISEKMIAVAKEQNISSNNIIYSISEAENLKFVPDFFDYIFCFAVYDALNQEQALSEFNRMLKHGGRLLFTGKNSDYMPDDELALEAEISARRKKHPNYFTDVKKLLSHLNEFGFSIISQRYFIYRGDCSKEEYVSDPPENFYEFEFIIEKMSSFDSDIKFSNEFSKTYSYKEST